MVTDDGEPTQQQTQSTQSSSQTETQDITKLWGYLVPCSPALRRMDLMKGKRRYSIGRNKEGLLNDIILPGMKISNFHAVINWDGDETPKSAVTITDTSSNGTFVSTHQREKIGKGKSKVLRDGNEVAFGTVTALQATTSRTIVSFVFRHLVLQVPERGLHTFYDMQHELGKGSFATVMKALHRTEGKWYAVKMIQANKLRRGFSAASVAGLRDDDKAANFAREINILEKLQHRNICQLKEVFFERYNINLVLEWVAGGDLLSTSSSTRTDSVTEAESQYLTYQMCDALAYVHDMGICHRDLKPENVLLTLDNPPIVKVADFGLAKVIDSMTMLRTMCGTPAYLAPEVVNQSNNEGYDLLVDSWSVGVIVFCMIAMCNPFDEDQDIDMKTRIANRNVQWNYIREKNVSEDCIDFLGSLLEIDPTKRMSLADARTHPWLIREHYRRQTAEFAQAAQVAPAVARSQALSSSTPPPAVARAVVDFPADASMASVADLSSDGMALDSDPVETGRQTPEVGEEEEEDDLSPVPESQGLGRHGSRLQRRVDVIRHAQRRGEDLPSPSQEMRAWAAAEDAEEGDAAEEDDQENMPPPVTPGTSRKRKGASSVDEGTELPAIHENGESPVPARGGRRGRSGARRAAVAPVLSSRTRKTRASAEVPVEQTDLAVQRRSIRLKGQTPTSKAQRRQ
ncbi:Pkinase-domain-containing protein [Epithele typhae]|uniref:Pkinase-domain-containing protein n=1 Tax=Epithele typhae TaxID=378194 RepID=UPI002007934D|nr:Pkinase-domain-containing protein [Epithele typhae]KAH9915026.1 Pkinase-domain-containing protein [Epithele typhae]